MDDDLTLSTIVGYLLSPLAGARKNRVDAEFKIGEILFTFKAYLLQSKERGNPVDMIRIDVKGE